MKTKICDTINVKDVLKVFFIFLHWIISGNNKKGLLYDSNNETFGMILCSDKSERVVLYFKKCSIWNNTETLPAFRRFLVFNLQL